MHVRRLTLHAYVTSKWATGTSKCGTMHRIGYYGVIPNPKKHFGAFPVLRAWLAQCSVVAQQSSVRNDAREYACVYQKLAGVQEAERSLLDVAGSC